MLTCEKNGYGSANRMANDINLDKAIFLDKLRDMIRLILKNKIIYVGLRVFDVPQHIRRKYILVSDCA